MTASELRRFWDKNRQDYAAYERRCLARHRERRTRVKPRRKGELS